MFTWTVSVVHLSSRAGVGVVLGALVLTSVAAIALAQPALAIIPVVLLFAAVLIPIILRVEYRSFIAFLSALLVIADGEYPKYDAITENLYVFFFTQVIPSFPTPFEITSYSLCFWVMLNTTGRGVEHRAIVSPYFRAMVTIGAGFLAAAIASTFFGLATGGQGRVAVWQLRAFPVIFMWMMIGFVSCRSLKDAERFLDVFTAGTVIKAVENVYILFDGHGGSVDPKLEYLSSHIGSFFMGIAMVRLTTLLWLDRRRALRPVFIASLALLAWIWIVNDRRVSFLGIGFTAIFSLPLLKRYITSRHVRIIGLGMVMAGALAVVTSDSSHSITSILVKDAKAEPDYRDIENYNLFASIADHPITGQGYGIAFEQRIKLPDIFHLGELLTWIPHNNLLMIWNNGGPIGVAALGVVVAFCIAVTSRLLVIGQTPAMKAFAFVAFATFVQWTLFIWADMAFAWTPSEMIPGTLAGFTYKLLYLNEGAGMGGKRGRTSS